MSSTPRVTGAQPRGEVPKYLNHAAPQQKTAQWAWSGHQRL